jgi:hypothetical protein
MKLVKLDSKGAQREAAVRGWQIETNQLGVRRLVIDGAVIGCDSEYSAVSFSIPAAPEKVTRYRVVAKLLDKVVDLGDYEERSEAIARRDEAPSDTEPEVVEVEVDEL